MTLSRRSRSGAAISHTGAVLEYARGGCYESCGRVQEIKERGSETYPQVKKLRAGI
jgi:hypothetical protein